MGLTYIKIIREKNIKREQGNPQDFYSFLPGNSVRNVFVLIKLVVTFLQKRYCFTV